MGLFGPSPPIDRDELSWMLACFAWLDRSLGAQEEADGFKPRLMLPSDPEFRSAATASELFAAVKNAADLGDWECRLEKADAPPERIDTGLDTGVFSEPSVLGTFSVDGQGPIIRYNPALLRKPDALIATFAHELAHLLIGTLDMPPGGEALEEHATDCAAVYLGFGVFLANGARNFSQFSDGAMAGWQSDTSGYLSENALVTATAIFERRFDLGENAGAALKKYLQPVYRKANRYLDKRHKSMADDLSAINLSDWA